MALSIQKAQKIVENAVGGTPSTNFLDILNDTSEWLSSLGWRFLGQGRTWLGFRASISITAGTWTDATLNLLSTGSFASYTAANGDRIEVTAGTGATQGYYDVDYDHASNDDDNLRLISSIGLAADGQTDIAASLNFDWLPLPADFMSEISVQPSNALTHAFEPVTRAELLELDRTSIGRPLGYWGAVEPRPDPDGRAPLYGYGIWPAPESTQARALLMYYNRCIPRVTTDSAYIEIPTWFEMLYQRTLRQIARAWDQEDVADLDERLGPILEGPTFRAAKKRDSNYQSEMGILRGGIGDEHRHYSGFAYRDTSVSGPS